MPITLNCPKCKKPFRVRDESVGLRVKCPNCQAILQVPASLAPASLATSEVPPSNPDSPPVHPPVTAPKPMAHPVTATPPPVHAEENPPHFRVEEPSTSPDLGPPSLPPHPVPQGRTGAKSRPKPVEVPEPIETSPPRSNRDRGRLPERDRDRGRESPARKTRIPGEDAIEEIDAWKSVRGGLRWVQFGFVLALIPALRCFGEVAYLFATLTYDSLPKYNPDAHGYLGLATLNFGQEIAYGLSFVPLFLAYLFLLIGRMKCTATPASAHPRGLAGGTLFFTFIAFLGLLGFAVAVIGPKVADPQLPHYFRPIVLTAFIAFGLLAELWFVLYLGQAGLAVGNTKILREFGLSAFLIVCIIAGVPIAEQFYPLSNFTRDGIVNDISEYFDTVIHMFRAHANQADDDNGLRRILVTTGITGGIAFLCLFRLIAMAGMLRRSLRRWVEDHAVADV